jgi:hypothetical protein
MIPLQRQSNKTTTIDAGSYNPLKAHDVGQLDKLGDQHIGAGIEFNKLHKGAFTKQLRAHNSKHKTNHSMQEFAELVIESPNFHKKTKARAGLYLNVLNHHKHPSGGKMSKTGKKILKGIGYGALGATTIAAGVGAAGLYHLGKIARDAIIKH